MSCNVTIEAARLSVMSVHLRLQDQEGTPPPMRHSDVKANLFPPQAIAAQRWDAIDVARGLAILAMIVYHFSWDLSFLQLIQTNILQVPAWRWFARGIAGSFLMLAGFGL